MCFDRHDPELLLKLSFNARILPALRTREEFKTGLLIGACWKATNRIHFIKNAFTELLFQKEKFNNVCKWMQRPWGNILLFRITCDIKNPLISLICHKISNIWSAEGEGGEGGG